MTMSDLRSVDCDLLTIGQYLRPSQKHVALAKWYTPEEFAELKREAEALWLSARRLGAARPQLWTYHADEQHATATAVAV